MSRLLAVASCCAALTACSAGTATPRTPLKFSSTHGGVTTTVIETRVPVQMTFDRFARDEPKMLRRALHAQSVRVTPTRIGDSRALAVSYRLSRKRVRQYFVRSGELMYVVTHTSARR